MWSLQCSQFKRLVYLMASDWAACSTSLETCRRGIVPGQELPQIPTVYVITRRDANDTDQILYVGQTVNLRNRARQHEANARICASQWDRLSFFVPGIDSKTARLAIEGAMILLLRPPLNQAILLKLTAHEGLSEIRWSRRRGKSALSAGGGDWS